MGVLEMLWKIMLVKLRIGPVLYPALAPWLLPQHIQRLGTTPPTPQPGDVVLTS